MLLPGFDYFAPKTLEEACSLLAQYQGQARVIAGGTDLLVRMKQRVATPQYLVNIKSIPALDYIRYNDREGLRIGALTPLHSLETSSLVRERFPILARAASSVASAQVRSQATIGGNICLETRCWYFNQSRYWRSARPPCFKTGGERCHVVKKSDRCYSLFSADTVPPLIALGAKIRIAGLGKQRTVPLEDFYTGSGEPSTHLQPDEIIIEVQVPKPAVHSGGSYEKFSTRGAVDFAIASAAAAVSLNPDGACSEARVVLGAIAPAPVRAQKAEAELHGRKALDRVARRVAEVAVKEAGPIVYIGAPVDYKRRLAAALVSRAIKAAWHQACQNEQANTEQAL